MTHLLIVWGGLAVFWFSVCIGSLLEVRAEEKRSKAKRKLELARKAREAEAHRAYMARLQAACNAKYERIA